MVADDYSAGDTADLLGLQSFKSDVESGWDGRNGNCVLLGAAVEKSATENAATNIKNLHPVPSSTEEMNEAAAAYQRQAQWLPIRKRGGASSGQEKMYQGRTTSQYLHQPSSSKFDAASPWTELQQQKHNQQTELQRPKRLSQSSSTQLDGRARKFGSHKQDRRRSRSLSFDSSSTNDLNDGPYAPQPSFTNKPLKKRRSISADRFMPEKLSRKNSLHGRNSTDLESRKNALDALDALGLMRPQQGLERRNSNQELHSRSILAGSLQDQDFAWPRRKSIATINVPLKEEARVPSTTDKEWKPSERGRRKECQPNFVRRRSRSLGSASSGDILHDLIPVAHLPLIDKPKERRRSLSWDSGCDVTNDRFGDIEKSLEHQRASGKAEVERMPAVRNTKKIEDVRQRYSIPKTTKSAKTDFSSKSKSHKIEALSEALKAVESSGRMPSSRRAKASERYSRLQSSVNKSFRRKTKSSSAPVAAAATVASGEAVEEVGLEKKRSGFYISLFMMSVMCFCYLISLITVCILGFWLHMEFFAYKETGTTVNSNVDVSKGTSPGDSGAGLMIRPSLRPSLPTSSINLQPIPSDGGLVTKGQVSVSPTAKFSGYPSSIPSTIISGSPSYIPTSSPYPTSHPSTPPSNLASESPSMEPTTLRSESPSLSPTVLGQCPEKLSRSMPFISDTSLTLYYETLIYRDHPTGGLLCASLEYSGVAGWIGIAFSTAGRNPQFGRREAIIGIPGVESSVAVSSGNATSQALDPSGDQINAVAEGPIFYNPAKYEIPAGGLEGYYGPSLELLMKDHQQTLVNASVTTSYESNQTITRLSFAKFLREPGEIEIAPLSGPTLILYAVATLDVNGTYVTDYPEWQYINIILGASSDTSTSIKRKRQHNN